MRLFHVPPTGRGIRVLWMLEELDAPYELVRVPDADRSSAAHLARQPLGKSPALELDDGTVLFESAAICLHLADQFAGAGLIAPPATRQRARAYQWVSFTITELEKRSFAARTAAPDDPRRDALIAAYRDAAAVLDRALADRELLVGQRFSVADLVAHGGISPVAALGYWDGLENVARFYAALQERPARVRALELGLDLGVPA